MHKHAHKHANMIKNTWMFTHNYIYLNIHTLGWRKDPNTAKSKRKERKRVRAGEVEGQPSAEMIMKE